MNKKLFGFLAAITVALCVLVGCAGASDNAVSVLSEVASVQASSQGASSNAEADAEGSQFRVQQRLDEHYEKHVIKQKEFGDITKDEYLGLAQQLIDHPTDSVLHKKDGDDTIYYDPNTNSFGVKSGDGYIRTFFKPSDGQEYYERQ